MQPGLPPFRDWKGAISSTRRGNVSRFPGYLLIHWILENKFTGELRIEGVSPPFKLDFRNGDPIADLETVLRLSGTFHGRYFLKSTSLSNDAPTQSTTAFFQSIDSLLREGRPIVTSRTPISGTIPSGGGALLLSHMARVKATGKLVCSRGNHRKLFRWYKGRLTSVSSSNEKETLAAVLERWAFVERSQLKTLLAEWRNRGGRFRDLLSERGALDPPAISRALAILHAERALEFFSWTEGSYRFAGTMDDDDDLRLNTAIRISPARSWLIIGDTPSLPQIRKIFLPEPETSRPIVVIDTDTKESGGFDPSRWGTTPLWESGRLEKQSENFYTLPLARSKSPLTNEAEESVFRRLTDDLSIHFERILWLARDPGETSTLFRIAEHVVLGVRAHAVSRRRIRRRIGEIPLPCYGFIFFEEEPKTRWHLPT